MRCETKGVDDVEPDEVAPGIFRCPACGEFVTEDMVPLDPQPRVLLDLLGDDPPDPGWQHVVFAVTIRARTWVDPTLLATAVSAYFEHGSHREGIYLATEDLIEGEIEPDEFDPDGQGIGTWGHRVIGVQYTRGPEHDRLLDHYAPMYATEQGMTVEMARTLIDVQPAWQGLLGRNGNWEGACKLAGIEPYTKTPIIPMVND